MSEKNSPSRMLKDSEETASASPKRRVSPEKFDGGIRAHQAGSRG